MNKKIALFLLLFAGGTVYAQDLDTLDLDSYPLDTLLQDTLVDEPPPYYGGIYFSREVKISPHYGGYNHASGFGAGLQYERWILGFTVYRFEGVIEELIIFPNVFELDYRYGGPTVGYELVTNDWFSIDALGSLHFGDMVWRNVGTRENLFRDEFSLITLAVKMDLDKFRYAKPYVHLGYQKAQNLAFERVEADQFTGFVFVFGIQIGYFNQ